MLVIIIVLFAFRLFVMYLVELLVRVFEFAIVIKVIDVIYDKLKKLEKVVYFEFITDKIYLVA